MLSNIPYVSAILFISNKYVPSNVALKSVIAGLVPSNLVLISIPSKSGIEN